MSATSHAIDDRQLPDRRRGVSGECVRAEEEKVLLCVGLGFGRMLRIGDTDVFGAEVNAASKLGEDTARPSEILVTGAVQSKAGDLPGVKWEAVNEVPPGPTVPGRQFTDNSNPRL